MENKNASATIITGRRTRLSYANLFEPKGFDGAKPMYSVSLIIPKDDHRTLEKINAAIKAAYESGAMKLRGNSRTTPALEDIHLPLNDGDVKRKGDPAYANAYYINAKNRVQPTLFDVDGTQCMEDRSVLYSGCYARCKIQFYVYNKGMNKGIACALLGVHKDMDGEPLGGSVTTSEDFRTDEEYGDGADFLK